MKNNLLKMATIVAIASSITFSCNKDVAKNYPIEVTAENWKEFVNAPDAVIERLVAEELEERTMTPVVEDRKVAHGRRQLGLVRTWSGMSSFTGYWKGISRVNIVNGNAISVTNSNGYYIVNTATGGSNMVCMNYDGGIMNGVSRLDLILIQRHISGVSLFDNVASATDAARRYVAADIDHDGSITTADVTLLSQIILGNGTFLGVDMVFVPESLLVLSQVTNPSFLSNRALLNSCKIAESNFLMRYAVKIGDVSGNFSF
ncbi:MAG: hypothetical protein ACI976_001342 [Aureispira sp.]|jgi:hypothetical protein